MGKFSVAAGLFGSDGAAVSQNSSSKATGSHDYPDVVDLATPSRNDPHHVTKENERRKSRRLLEQVRTGSLRVAYEGARTRQIVIMARENSDRQVDLADHIFRSSQESNQALNDIAKRTEGLSESNRKAVEIARETGNRLDSAASGLNRAHNQMASFQESVEQLSKASDNISRISAMVRDFSKKTNLLALNAAIEAARAGESGASFTVVAEEVRSLANKVAESNEEIRSTLEQMNSLVAGASAGAQEIADQTGQAQQVLNDATEQFHHLLSDSEANYAEIEQIGTAMEELTHTNHSVYQSTAQIKDLGEKLQQESVQSDEFSRLLRETAENNLAQLCRARTGAGPIEDLLGAVRRVATSFRLCLRAFMDKALMSSIVTISGSRILIHRSIVSAISMRCGGLCRMPLMRR
ncbi:methyl-accepting chemotaxis protein [Halorhodospira halochloris]|uniref:methyl-accepting chemotaxis protein n=1 Tax=Halorhodospira halochloris TaxID=1052 RepID=UPI001EE99815|nr:methyl-accepting chemotaxis protein [Halorhodospira halochloris]MCG5530499.1 methyl-accepting chemotaxis protein [Halorhodospira halochloris]